jgi:hypothetical protein
VGPGKTSEQEDEKDDNEKDEVGKE